MITPPAGARVYLACGSTDMRKGMATLAMLVQQTLGHDPFCGTVYAFRGRRSGLIKLLWHDGVVSVMAPTPCDTAYRRDGSAGWTRRCCQHWRLRTLIR